MNRCVSLRNGVKMPLVGLGTYQVKGPECVAAVTAALQAGYRAIDTAAVYFNEAQVADGIAASGVPRDQIFITSKLQPRDAGSKAYEACLASLHALRTDWLDLYLIHWPGAGGHRPDDPRLAELRRQSWSALERLYNEGKVRAIGVSNFTPRHLEELCTSSTGVPPMVNQFELHPLLQQRDIVSFCAARGIVVTAYSSLARGAPELLHHAVVAASAARHSVTPAQVVLKWALQHGWTVIPKSVHAPRILENGPGVVSEGWCLSDQEMAAIDSLEGASSGGLRTCWDPTAVA